MAGKPKTLKIKFDGDATGLESATKQAGATLERLEADAKEAAGGLDRVGDAGEGVADSSSLATGALGALASGFELIGAEGAAESLQKAALATDFMSGVGDSLTLVTQKLGLAKLKDKAATIGQTVATKAQTAAAKAQTIAQRALNLALRMNPIGMVITAIVGLIAILVIAYKKSDTFRRIVDKAFRAVKNAAQFAWDWIKKNWPLLLAIITGPIGLAVYAIAKNWDRIKAGAARAKDYIVGRFSALVSFVRGLPGRISSAAGGMWDGIKSSFRGVLNSIIGWWNGLSFSLPSIKIPGTGKSVGGFTLSTPNIGYLAAGGYAAPGRSYIVGENGPELLTMGGNRGFVTPNGQLEGAGAPEIRVFIGDQELRGLVRTEISSSNRSLKRQALAGRTL